MRAMAVAFVVLVGGALWRPADVDEYSIWLKRTAGQVITSPATSEEKAVGLAGVHLGAAAIMVRYETPEVTGTPRAALIVDGPFDCPLDGPHPGEQCADIVWWVNERGVDPENTDPTLSDWRKNVLFDPTGTVARSFHLWGQAPGETSPKR